MAMWICLIALVLVLAPVEPGPRYSSRIVDTQAGPGPWVLTSVSFKYEPDFNILDLKAQLCKSGSEEWEGGR
ncbi:hypothetical protein J6590_096512 [Homalodisca vitripennis]|nr:hypothetical protein J6590_096512 [Homalodisca vitripennis]